MGVQYLPAPYAVYRVPITLRGDRRPGQDEMGYGQKITTDLQVSKDGKRYRVYATCWSNAASNWIKRNGQVFHLLDTEVIHEQA